MTLHSFVEMGGYAAYVWPAYGITFVVFALNALLGLTERKRVRRQVQRYFAKQTSS